MYVFVFLLLFFAIGSYMYIFICIDSDIRTYYCIKTTQQRGHVFLEKISFNIDNKILGISNIFFSYHLSMKQREL